MKIEDHLEKLKESLEVIRESIEQGINKRQRTLGFHISSAAIDMFEIFLHKNNLIDPGVIIKHDWFSSRKRAEEKIKFDFPKKEKIIELLNNIEKLRNLLCYGKPNQISNLKKLIECFNELKQIFIDLGLDFLKWT